jgi:stage V sporulation protein R
VNPYNLGIHILREIMRIASDPDDEERERWSWAGNVDPLEQLRMILSGYDDEALLREFLTPKVCELSRLYAFDHVEHDPRRIRISSREADAIRDTLIPLHSTVGIPSVVIVDADFRGRGELLLEHRHTGVGLDEEYARGTLAQLAILWGKPVTVTTINGRKAEDQVWFTGHPDGRSDRHASEPGKA